MEDDDEEDRRRAVEMREAVAKRLRDSVEKELRLATEKNITEDTTIDPQLYSQSGSGQR